MPPGTALVVRNACASAGAAALQVAEEVAVRLQHQQVLLGGQGFPVGLQAAVETEELRIAVAGAGINRGRPGITLTTDALGITVGFGQQYGAGAIGFSANLFRFLATTGAVLGGITGTLGAHPREHALTHIGLPVELLDTDINNLDTKLFERTVIDV